MSERWPFDVMCCFSGQKVEQEYPDPGTVVVSTAKEEEWQQWYCHSACFLDQLVNKGS